MRMRSMILGTVVTLGLASLTRASVMYSYIVQPQGGSVTLNSTDTLNLYLQEVSTSGSFTAASDGGLFSGGVALVEQAGGAGVTFNSVTANGATEPNGFTGNSTKGLVTGGGAWIADITNSAQSTPGVAAASVSTVSGTTTSLYFLGSTSVTVGATPNATFKVESLHDAPGGVGITPAGSNFNTLTQNSGNDLDVTSTNPAYTGANSHASTFTVSGSSPVPEPASMAIFGIGAAGLLIRRQRTA